MPIPSGSIDEAQRQQLLYGYAGILWQYTGRFTEDFITAATKDTRNPKAMVRVTWADGASDFNSEVVCTDINHVDRKGQVVNGKTTSDRKWAYIHSGLKANGTFYPCPEKDSESQMGYFGLDLVCDASGNFSVSPQLQINHDHRSYTKITVAGDSEYNEYPVDFTIEFYTSTGQEDIEVTGNTERVYETTFAVKKNVYAIQLRIDKWSTGSTIAKIVQFSGSLIETYRSDDITELSILEETNSDTGTVPIGNVSSNELSLSLQNTDRRFSFGNTDSEYNNSLVTGRKIEVWLGFVLPAGSSDASGDVEGYIVETDGGEKIGYMPYGVYWSKDWVSNFDSMETSTTAYDIVYQLSQKDFLKSLNYNDTVENIVDDILTNALDDVPFFEWEVNSDVSADTLGTLSFESKNYMEVLKDLAEVTLSYIFVNRNGVLIVGSRQLTAETPILSYQEIGLAEYFNFKSQPKTDELINLIRVGYTEYQLQENQAIYSDESVIEIPAGQAEITIWVTWNTVPVNTSSCVVVISQVTGTPIISSLDIYANGAEIIVEGIAGDQFTISANGQPYELIENTETTKKNQDSINAYGTREFALTGNQLITTPEQANTLADNLNSFYGEELRKDALIDWWGGTLLAVGDTLEVVEFKNDTIETKDYFVIKRQTTTFDGSLQTETELRRVST